MSLLTEDVVANTILQKARVSLLFSVVAFGIKIQAVNAISIQGLLKNMLVEIDIKMELCG